MHSKLLQLCQISYFITIIMSETVTLQQMSLKILADSLVFCVWMRALMASARSIYSISLFLSTSLAASVFPGAKTQTSLLLCWKENYYTHLYVQCDTCWRTISSRFNAHEFIELIVFITNIVTAFIFVSLHRCACQLLDGIWGMHFAFFKL